MRAERIMKNKGGPTRDFFCVDASSMQTVAVGTEYSVLLFDAGSGKLIHTLSDVHTEDVTQVHFHPTAPQILLSASVDGCINAFDVQAAMRSGGQSSQSQSQGAEGAEGEGDEVEDDGIQWTWNAQDSVSKIGITGSQAQWCYVTTHTEGLQVYHLPSQERVIDYGQRVREALGCDYIVDVLGCAPGDDQEQSLLVAAGKFTGEVVVAQCGLVDGQVRPLEQLHGGHSAVVRACVWDKVHNRLITGGEDSRLTVWSQQSASSVHDPTTGASSSSSAKSERDREKSRYSPY
jgi:WD40 repeat protein